MPQKVLKFTGINRKVNEFQSSGACEELINLRPDVNGGHHVVKPKVAIKENVQYDGFYEHSYGGVYNQIAITNGLVEWINPKGGGSITITDEFVSKNVSISHAGNVLVIYCEDDKKQVVFKFEDEEYKSYFVVFDHIYDVKIIYGNTRQQATNYAIADDDSEGSYNEAMNKSASGFHNKYPHGLCGASIVGCAYELDDGSELWSTAFIVANPARSNWPSTPIIDKANKKISTHGAANITLTLSFGDIKQDNVKKINIYSTKPVYPYEISFNAESVPSVKEVSLDDAGLSGMIMYYQGSVTPRKGEVSLRLKFGTTLAGDAIMNVNAGCIERIGKSVSYNNRFHFYKSEVRHAIQYPSISNTYIANASEAEYWIAYVNINNEWKLINNMYRWTSGVVQDFIYPMAGVKKLAFVKATPIKSGQMITGVTVPYTEMFFVDMKDSAAYNYSYAFDVTPSVVSVDNSWYNEIQADGQLWDYANANGFDETVFWKSEVNAINVSAPFNPFVFPVELSYSFGGEIIDIATSYLPISATQVGQYPLNVFTSNGIYALEQGNGAVLYSNIVPLQPLVLDGSMTATPYGTFFISSKSLYLLSGRESANVSYVLGGERELTLRELEAYKKLVCNKSGVFYDFSPILSGEDFEEFITDVSLVYDQLQNELFISSRNEEIPYSYVLNLDTKAYHKVVKRYLPAKSGSRYAIETIGSNHNLVDLYHEKNNTDQCIMLQSRPMSFEVAFTHIQRLLLLADAKLEKSQNLCFSVFASDNLYDWKCIISAQKQSTILRQIRTNRAAKSYRDYVILITGTVDTDTDISDIIADYTIVNRRLG